MIIMDSDVLLALVSSDNRAVEEWVKELPSKPHTSALAVAEVYAAIRRSPQSMFRESRSRAMNAALQGVLHRRVLPFDGKAARELAELATTPHPEGSTYPLATLIPCATARALGTEIVTGRPDDFLRIDVDVDVDVQSLDLGTSPSDPTNRSKKQG